MSTIPMNSDWKLDSIRWSEWLYPSKCIGQLMGGSLFFLRLSGDLMIQFKNYLAGQKPIGMLQWQPLGSERMKERKRSRVTTNQISLFWWGDICGGICCKIIVKSCDASISLGKQKWIQ